MIKFLIRMFFEFKKKKPYMINIEGIDGTGKETTSRTLEIKLINLGYKVKTVAYPQYGKWHSFLVTMYLRGTFGKDPMKINPKLASIFYAIDRFFHWHLSLRWQVNKFDFIIFDRHTASNIIHQAAKGLKTWEEISIAGFVLKLEHRILRIPRPHLIVILNLPVSKAIEAMKDRKKTDIHESAISYLEDCVKAINLFSGISKLRWYKIDTYNERTGVRQTPQDIVEMIYGMIDYHYLK
jgi:dTMP kinase